MPTNKPRTKLILDDDVRREIELYQQRTGVKVQSKAIIDLIILGAQSTLAELDAKRVFSSDELLLLDAYRASDPVTRKKVIALLGTSALKNDRRHQKPRPGAGYNLVNVMQLYDVADASTQAAVVALLEENLIATFDEADATAPADDYLVKALDEKIIGSSSKDTNDSSG